MNMNIDVNDVMENLLETIMALVRENAMLKAELKALKKGEEDQ